MRHHGRGPSKWAGKRRAGLIALGALALLFGCEIRFGYDDDTSCGSCSLYQAESTCSEGKCAVEFCYAGYDDCDGIASNGCEISLRNSWYDCGLCGNVCTNDVGCIEGVCAPTTELARPGLISESVVLASDERDLYVGYSGEISGILRISKTTGSIVSLAPASRVRAIVTDDTSVYWLEASGPPALDRSFLRRIEKAAASSGPATLATVDTVLSSIVLQGEFVYFAAPFGGGDRLARVHTSGTSGVELVPGWQRPGLLFGLQASGAHVAFGFSTADVRYPMVVEYAPETESFSIVDDQFRGFVFALDETSLYYEDPVASGDPATAVISWRSRESGLSQSALVPRAEFRSMQVDRGSLFLLDPFHGSLLEIELDSSNAHVVFGAQTNLGNIALDAASIYFADGNRILRLPR